jgi:Cu-processing system permease protein
VIVVAAFALRESLRRRVFLVVAILTLVFLALYGLGVWQAFKSVTGEEIDGVDERVVAGATLLGLSMFATLFLGTILAVFLTLGAVRGDVERGLLQPLVVRPLRRRDLLLGRFGAAASVCAAYVSVVFLACAALTWAFGDWWPDRTLLPALRLALGMTVVCALSLAGSVVLASTANGIAVFMAFGAGLTAGLLGQIAEFIDSPTLEDVSSITAWALPFEAHYQAALSDITAHTIGITSLAISLGPFGGPQAASTTLWLWTLLYLLAVGVLGTRAFDRRDLG